MVALLKKSGRMTDQLEATFVDLLAVMGSIDLARFDTEGIVTSTKEEILANLGDAWDRAEKSYLEIGRLLGTKRANELVEKHGCMNSAESWRDTTLLFC